MDGITWQEVTTKDYSTPYVLAQGSTRNRTDMREIFEQNIFLIRTRKLIRRPIDRKLSNPFEIDLSSVYPQHIDLMNVTFLTGKHKDNQVNELFEYDIFLRMAPIEERTVKARIKSIEKASPKIIEE